MYPVSNSDIRLYHYHAIIQALRAEQQAAAKAGAPLAARPAHWAPPLDPNAVVEYVTLDMAAEGDSSCRHLRLHSGCSLSWSIVYFS